MTTATKKTTCPITRQQFTQHGAAATPVVTIAGQGVAATPRTFSTDSVGYYGTGKVQVMIDGVPTMCQVSVNITVVGSKELPKVAMAESQEVAAIRAAAKAKEDRDNANLVAASKAQDFANAVESSLQPA